LDELAASASAAVTSPACEGKAIRYLRSIFVPVDEICFHLYRAASLDDVTNALEQACLDHERIVEAVEVEGVMSEPVLTATNFNASLR
jgi:hypothetical protein